MTATVAPKRDLPRVALGVWALVCIAFLLLPIVFVIAHSFNGGNSFSIWLALGCFCSK